MSQGLPVGLGPGFGVVILVALVVSLFWCGWWSRSPSLSRRGQSSHSGEKPPSEIWTKSSTKLKKSDKTRKEGGKLQSTNTYEEGSNGYNIVYVNPKGNHHHNDKKKKKGGLGKGQMIQESEEEEYQNITKKMKENEKEMRNGLESEGDYIYHIEEEEEDYGDGYGGYQDIRKPVLKRVSTEETYENDTKPGLKHQNFATTRQDTEEDYTYENGEN